MELVVRERFRREQKEFVVASCDVAASDSARFDLSVPPTVVPGFVVESLAVAHELRLRDAGGRVEAEPLPVVVLANPDPLTAEQAAAFAGAIGVEHAKKDRSHHFDELLWAVFTLVTVPVLVGLGIGLTIANPSDAEGGGRFAGLALFGGMALLFGVGGVVNWYRAKGRRVGAVDVTVPEVVRAGQPVAVEATVGGKDAVAVGLVCELRYTDLKRVGQQWHATSAEKRLGSVWKRVPPGTHRFEFAPPAALPSSYPGSVAQVVHLVRVTPEGRHDASARWALTRNDHLLVVLP
ncbi:MAG: hypothetical protein KDI09_04155 [Halioglobus sp.]|nr:hypothetical protein [Halioglobus sp.]